MDPQVGQLINNKYRLVRLIGDGGMGSVFEAKHELLGTTVALKFLHNALARRKGLVERFLQEAQVSARIRSRHVVSVSDVDRTADGLAYMVMEYVEGETLQMLYEKHYQRGDRLSYGDAFDIMLQMLEGVSAAHSLGIIHRDLKPDNVMLSDDGRGGRLVKILDFGIAKLKASGEVDRGLTRPGVVMGTPEYMAPEQAFSADKGDARADVFSLGVMFFEMLAGRRPVGGDNAHAIAAQYLEGTIAQLRDLAPSVAPKLAAAVHKAMAAKPEDRFDTVDGFRDAIAPYAPDGAGTAASKSDAAGPLAQTANAQPGDTPIPKTVPPEQTFSENGGPVTESDAVQANTAGGDSDGGATGEGGTASMEAAPDKRGDAQPSPLRAGTEPMAEGAVEAQIAAMRAPTADMGGSSGSTQVGEPFSPPPYAPNPPGPSPVGPAPVVSPGYSPPVERSGRRKKSGPPLLAILAIAAGVSAAVVGGVYVAHQAGAREAEHDDPIDVTTPPPATVVQETPPPDPQPTTYTPPPTPTPTPVPPTPQPTPPAQPPPKPQTQPPTKPPPTQPPPPNPWVIPSALPGLPGIPGLTPPQPPPPAQPPPPTGKKPSILKPGKKPSILKPGGAGQPKPHAGASGSSGTSTENKPETPKPSILRLPGTITPKAPSDGSASKPSKRPSTTKRPSVLFPRLTPKR